MRAKSIRIVSAEQSWALDIEGTSEPHQLFPTLEAAMRAGWSRARRENFELHIQALAGGVWLRAESILRPTLSESDDGRGASKMAGTHHFRAGMERW